jgi:S1-C subfamily serine protease
MESSVRHCHARDASLKCPTIEAVYPTMRHVFAPARSLALAVALAMSIWPAQAVDLPAEKIYDQSLPSVLTLRVENRAGDRYVGTAFLAIQPGIAVTAWHVVYDAVKVTAKFADGASCEVLGFIDYDETKDIALIKVESKERPLMTIATARPSIGARAYVIGSPKGYEFSIGDGLLSQVQKVDGFNQYQVSCPFSPGNSGGPILNSRGEVMGVAAWTRNGAQNVNFATPANEVLSLNAQKPITRWKEIHSKKKGLFSSAEGKKRSAPANESTQSAQDLKKLLQKSTGKEVTVIVTQEGQQERFTFTVPAEFVK